MMRIFIALVSGACLGIIFTLFIRDKEHGVSPIHILHESISADIPMVQPLIPMNINLKILSDDEFDRVKAEKWTGAFTVVGDKHRKCEITVPVSMGNILFNPSKGHSPRFEDKYSEKEWGGEVLTHEILHCIIGYWHYQ